MMYELRLQKDLKEHKYMHTSDKEEQEHLEELIKKLEPRK